jgi:2'-5' RNA ligase
MTERWRCFVAVPLDEDLRARLAGAVDGWRTDPRTDGLRWTATESLHLTLAFIGDVDHDRVPTLTSAIELVGERHARLVAPTGRLGAFARPSSARIVWYGVGDPEGRLGALAADLAAGLELEAVPEPYRPHVTLARARRGWLDLRGWIEAASASAPEGQLSLTTLDLMRSHLGGGPARYERLASVTLA